MGMPTPTTEKRSTSRFLAQALILAAIMFSSLGCYLFVLKWRGPAASFVTQTAWDRQIPFWPSWVWAYLFPYLIGPAVAGMLSRRTFHWYIRRGLILVVMTLVIFIAVPTQTVRPSGQPLGEGLTAMAYHNMVAVDDPPANAAPSLHVSLTFLLALAAMRDYPRWWPVALGAAAIVWLATLFTWQHHLIDVGTGILAACLVALPGLATLRRSVQPARSVASDASAKRR
jgi:hypothetical protein